MFSWSRSVTTRLVMRTASMLTVSFVGRAFMRHTAAPKKGDRENRRAHSTLEATAHPHRSRKGYPGSFGLMMATAWGSSAGGL